MRSEYDIIQEMDRMIFRHEHDYSPRKVKRIDLDDFEWKLFLKEVTRLRIGGILDYRLDMGGGQYFYKGIEIVQR